MRSATALGITALILAVSASNHANAAPAAQALGDAYRAYERGDFQRAHDGAAAIDRRSILNKDYALFVIAQSAALLGNHNAALKAFRALSKRRTSRFAPLAQWRIADSLWALGDHRRSASLYTKLVTTRGKKVGDLGLARFRIAEAMATRKRVAKAVRAFRGFVVRHPDHALARRAMERLRQLGGEPAARLSAADRLRRAAKLKTAHKWREAIHELSLIGERITASTKIERDYALAMTLFKMRRDYKRAGDTLLGLYKKLDKKRQPRALFHGARALSRADFDAQAITWYLRLVREYPGSHWAIEAHYLAGWLEYNIGNYKAAIAHFTTMRKRHPKSRWAQEALWFLGYSHYLLGQHSSALPLFSKLSTVNSRFVGGKGRYWHARTLQKMAAAKPALKTRAMREYRDLVRHYPMSWYALLARARVSEAGGSVPMFGDSARHNPDKAPAIAQTVPAARSKIARDQLIRRADELIEARLDVEAGVELRLGEKAYLARFKTKRASALALLLDRYHRAHNFTRPWMISIVYGGRRALDAPPTGRAKIWWKHCYPEAYKSLVEKHAGIGKNPPYYLYAIMRQESGFDPHVLSYANAIGLVQMIPRTTKKVVKELGLQYTSDMLWDPQLNLKTGSWYIGRLLAKFKGQIPYGAGSFNSGPKPVMRWMDKSGSRPTDEFVELVSYSQTREYMKRVTEHYARYLYLYTGKIYEQPLTVVPSYVKNDLTY